MISRELSQFPSKSHLGASTDNTNCRNPEKPSDLTQFLRWNFLLTDYSLSTGFSWTEFVSKTATTSRHLVATKLELVQDARVIITEK